MKLKSLQIMILLLSIFAFAFISKEIRIYPMESSSVSLYNESSATPEVPQSTATIIEPPTQEEYNLIRIMTGLVFISVIIVLFALWVNRSHISL